MIPRAHELDDGTTEAVDCHPRRRSPNALTVAAAADSPVGGKMARMRAEHAKQRDDFVSIRAPLGTAKVMLGHLTVFTVLWRLWAAKRVDGTAAGVSVTEIAETMKLRPQKVRDVLTTLIRNRIVRSVRTNVGWANVRAAFFPTELGTQILALCEALGPGSSIQVGRNATAWRSRTNDEPESFFRHAAMLRGTKT